MLARVWPFRRSRAQVDADRLVAVVSQISRQPGFFGEGRAADTLEGRLELVTLHGCLALMRLQREPDLEPLAQGFTDALFRSFDAGLREAGVGDTSVPKRMRKIAAGFYGRLESYAGALNMGDRAGLEAALQRNLLDGREGFAATLVAYVFASAALQANTPFEAMFRLDGWAPAPA